MNVESIFQALEQDMDNSGLGIICRELETQGYSVAINGVNVTSDEIFSGDHAELENDLNTLKFSLSKAGRREQDFSVKFLDYHQMAIINTESAD